MRTPRSPSATRPCRFRCWSSCAAALRSTVSSAPFPRPPWNSACSRSWPPDRAVQFYLNGYFTGAPRVAPVESPVVSPPLEDQGEVDVLIVGSGPAGLVLAAQLAQHEGITTRVVERRAGPLEFGQAHGIACAP